MDICRIAKWMVYSYFAFAKIEACQTPMQPVYNSTSKRHISCNVWEPDCPSGSICQPVGMEWKRKLDIHPKYILFLCCSATGGDISYTTGEYTQRGSPPTADPVYPSTGPADQALLGPVFTEPVETTTTTTEVTKPVIVTTTFIIPTTSSTTPTPSTTTAPALTVETPSTTTVAPQVITEPVTPATTTVAFYETVPTMPPWLEPTPEEISKPFAPSSPPQPEYHFFVATVGPDLPPATETVQNFITGREPPEGVDESEILQTLPPAATPPITGHEQPLFAGSWSSLGTPNEKISGPKIPPAHKVTLLPNQTPVFVPGTGFRRKPGAAVYLLVLGEYQTPAERHANTFKYSGAAVLVQDSGLNILVDTSSANNKNKLIGALAKYGIKPSNIQVIVYTHPHPDHIGNDNLFPYAQKIYGSFVYKNDELYTVKQLQEANVRLTTHVEIWQSPGHTFQHNSVIVRNVSNEETHHGTVAITGDLFLNSNDFANPSQWMDIAEDRQIQAEMRDVIVCEADFIIPGHGMPFPVSHSIRETALCPERKRKSKRLRPVYA